MIKVTHFSACIHLYYSATQVLVPIDQLTAHQCSGVAGSGGWKCPCCDVVSPTATAAQRPLDSPSGVKAFRCTICRYKGNTRRGMRTHIRMHFEKRSTDLQVCVTTRYRSAWLYSIVSKFMYLSIQDFNRPWSHIIIWWFGLCPPPFVYCTDQSELSFSLSFIKWSRLFCLVSTIIIHTLMRFDDILCCCYWLHKLLEPKRGGGVNLKSCSDVW
jgi:hypothetical protein